MPSLLQWRKEFPALENSVYLISHSLGAMPRRTRDRLNEYAEAWSTRGIRAWEEGWWEMPVTVGNLIGRIIGAAFTRSLRVAHRQSYCCVSCRAHQRPHWRACLRPSQDLCEVARSPDL